ncbi:MAG TPA: winged helix-turn-helix transcriptional regulator [Methanocorpusculum sp.]|nr:winged helix-turn-helix transcriptional regulator [Methanocorpusculum sp.]HJJ95581.1 winged helix-turn-helix transcriptional regulator [Methanocorpusculum sp.]
MTEDLLSNILRSKRETTRFQVLVEVAEHQPSIRQQEIAEKLGVTPQAISEYIRILVDDGLVSAEGRGRYYVTHKGVEWVINNAELLESYARHVRKDIIHQVVTWAAIADTDLKKGDAVGVYMKGGWLYAGKKPQTAMGMVANDAKEGDDVGVARLAGIIEHTEGRVEIAKVPRIERGGSETIDSERLKAVAKGVDVVGAVGLEAFLALKKADITPDMFFGAREGIIEASFHGMHCLMLIVDEEFTDFLKRMETSGLTYTVHELVK